MLVLQLRFFVAHLKTAKSKKCLDRDLFTPVKVCVVCRFATQLSHKICCQLPLFRRGLKLSLWQLLTYLKTFGVANVG